VTVGVLTLGVLTLGSDTGGVDRTGVLGNVTGALGNVTGGVDTTGMLLTGGVGSGGFGTGTLPLGGAGGLLAPGGVLAPGGGAPPVVLGPPIVDPGLVVVETPGASPDTVGELGWRLCAELRTALNALPICALPWTPMPTVGAPPVVGASFVLNDAGANCATVTAAWRCSASVFSRKPWDSVSRPAAPIAGRIVAAPEPMPMAEGIVCSPSKIRCGIVLASAHQATERREE